MDLGNLCSLCFYQWFFVMCLLLHLPLQNAISFNFPEFTNINGSLLNLTGSASNSEGILSLTGSTNMDDHAAGRAFYFEKTYLRNPSTGEFTNFTTHFSFKISTITPPGQDGLAFFLAADGSLPENAAGGCLALISQCDKFNDIQGDSSVVAVEFDTYFNKQWDDCSYEHVGININSIKSEVCTNLSRSMNRSRVDAWISYNSIANNLTVSWSFQDDPFTIGNISLSYSINLTDVLPESVYVGLSAASAYWFARHDILSWEFNSTEESLSSSGGTRTGLIVGCVIGGVFSACGIALILVFFRRRTRSESEETIEIKKSPAFRLDEPSIDNIIERDGGPKRFSRNELVQATKNFAEEGKLGQGGFGGVYKGCLMNDHSNLMVAVKKVSMISDQGKKAYISEVIIISRLRHRNLVQLIGWCHEDDDLLLVYEFMPNGSLDFHLFSGKTMLIWEQRYQIALGLASALLYLHEESGQHVVHRDIKASNIMLDSNFNAKLGDFGLARLTNEDIGAKTTGVAGTFGYMAPEYISTGRASKGSDVFSFGVVALEIACGIRATEPEYEAHVPLVGLVWESYGKKRILDMGYSKLSLEFEMKQMECLMIVGLCCAHPDQSLRPSMKQAMQVLNFEAPLPNLPSTMPVASYHATSDPPVSTVAPLLLYSSLIFGR